MAVQNDIDPLINPYGAYYFSLEIGTETIAQFRECSGLKTTTEVYEIEEGGNIGHTHKRPGHAKWENIVLKKGLTKGHRFAQWRNDYMYTPDSGWENRVMSSGSVVVRAQDGTELRRYSFNQAWPVAWEGPSVSSGGSDVAIETLEIAHEGLVIDTSGGANQTSSTTTGGGGGSGASSPAGGGGQGAQGNQGGQGGTSGGSSSQTMTANEGPRFTAGLFGHELTQANPLGSEEMIVEEHVDMMSAMRVRIAADGFPWGDVKLGDEATGAFGGHADMTFTGVVVSVRHFSKAGVDMIEVLALDGMIKLAASRMTKVWEDSTDSDIASSVLGDAGVEAGTVDSTSVTHKYVLQRNESNLDFLKRLAARNGYILMGNQDGTIDFKKPQFSGTAKEFGRGDVLSLDYTVSHQEVPPNVTVHGWTYNDKEMVEGTASSGDVDAIGGGANAVDETGTIWQDDMYITDVWVSDASAAKDMAVAELNRRARSFVRGRGVVHGDGAIRAGTKVKFKDFATGFNPEAFVVGTRHRIQGGTYTTEFFFESNTKPE